MAIHISCPSCGTHFKAPERAVGHRVKCLKCQTRIPVLPTATPLVCVNSAEAPPTPSADSAEPGLILERDRPTAVLTALLITGSALAFLLTVVVLVLVLVKNGVGPATEQRANEPVLAAPVAESVSSGSGTTAESVVIPPPKPTKAEPPEATPPLPDRGVRLARLESEEKAALEPFLEQQEKHKKTFERLRKEEEDLYKKTKFTPPKVAARIPGFLKELNRAVRQANKDTLALIRKREEFLQAKRRLILDNPLPDDPKLSEYAGLVLTDEEISDLGKQAVSGGSPRAAAQQHLAGAAGIVTAPAYNGVYQDPADADLMAVAYRVAAYRGKTGADLQAHVFIYRWRGAWAVLEVPGRANGILPGPPPADYKRKDGP